MFLLLILPLLALSFRMPFYSTRDQQDHFYSALKTLTVKALKYPSRGTGLQLLNETKASETVFCMAEDFALTPDDDWDLSNYLSGLNSIEKLAARIIFERVVGGSDIFFHAYANSLPASLNSPLNWRPSTWDLLEKYSLSRDIELKLNLSTSYEKIKAVFSKVHALNEQLLQTEVIDWGLRTVLSRYISFVEPGKGEIKVMIPYMDLANHWPRGDSASYKSFEREGKKYCIVSPFKRKSGDELFVDYGSYESSGFFLRFLMAHKNNPNEILNIKFKTKENENLNFALESSRINLEFLERITIEIGSHLKVDRNFREVFVKNLGNKKGFTLMKAVYIYRQQFSKFSSFGMAKGLRDVRRQRPKDDEEKMVLDYAEANRQSIYLHMQAVDKELLKMFFEALLKGSNHK